MRRLEELGGAAGQVGLTRGRRSRVRPRVDGGWGAQGDGVGRGRGRTGADK